MGFLKLTKSVLELTNFFTAGFHHLLEHSILVPDLVLARLVLIGEELGVQEL